MTVSSVPELFASVARRHFHVEVMGSNWQENLRRELDHPGHPERSAQFRQQFAQAILNRTITPAQYEGLTGEEFDTPEDLEAGLRELWRGFYGDEPVKSTP